MNKTDLTHRQDMKVVKCFHDGMKAFSQGLDRPYENSPELMGWEAAQEMDIIKKQWLANAKAQFVGKDFEI